MKFKMLMALMVLSLLLMACEPIPATKVTSAIRVNETIDAHRHVSVAYHNGSYLNIKESNPDAQSLKTIFETDGDIQQIEYVFYIDGLTSRQEVFWAKKDLTTGWYVISGPRQLKAEMFVATWNSSI